MTSGNFSGMGKHLVIFLLTKSYSDLIFLLADWCVWQAKSTFLLLNEMSHKPYIIILVRNNFNVMIIEAGNNSYSYRGHNIYGHFCKSPVFNTLIT